MGVQESFIKIKGRVGDLTFFRTKDGYQVREKKSALTGARIASDSKFLLTRQNGAEFGRAGRYSKAMRYIFRKATNRVSDGRMASRLTTVLLQVIKTDDVNRRGERTLLADKVTQLQGFQFNAASNFYDLCHAMCWGHIDRTAGNLQFFTEAFVPSEDLKMPEGATHFQLFAAGGLVDFENDGRPADIPLGPGGQLPDPEDIRLMSLAQTDVLPIDDVAIEPVQLNCPVLADRSEPLFLLAGIRFFVGVNGFYDMMGDSKHHALTLISTNML